MENKKISKSLSIVQLEERFEMASAGTRDSKKVTIGGGIDM